MSDWGQNGEDFVDQRELLPIARGGISLVDGTFRSFGQDLDIETGQVLYAGVPVTEPEIFLRAVRWIDADPSVSAVGVQLSGPATAPELRFLTGDAAAIGAVAIGAVLDLVRYAHIF